MTILYGSGISNSNAHAGDNLPLMLVGGGAGTLKGGRHLEYTDQPSMANLLVTLMDKLGVPVEKLGGSTGRLPIEHAVGCAEDSERPADWTDRADLQVRRVAGPRGLTSVPRSQSCSSPSPRRRGRDLAAHHRRSQL